jgi:arylsulfatase A-like enzyme/pimeloyl-ACP methyl ester carboxylesterase
MYSLFGHQCVQLRAPMRWLLGLAVALCFGAITCGASAARPNVLVILSDDQRADTIAERGNQFIVTPTLDRLARSGTAFTQAYCMGGLRGAVCVPARAMLMTGRGLFRVNEEIGKQPTWPEQFERAGYVTHACGKWHNGRESLAKAFPTGRAIFLGGMGAPYTAPLFQFERRGAFIRHPRPAGMHTVEVVANAAIDFLRGRNADRPFLLYVAMPSPHDPRIAPARFHTIYNAKKPPLPRNFMAQHPFDNGEMAVRDEQLEDWPRTEAAIRQHLADYYASITFMDEQIGRVLAVLDETGAATNTMIAFASDQGLAIGSHGLMGKQNVYEDGMRIPLIFSGPGIPAGRSSSALAYLHDLFSTAGGLCDVRAPRESSGIDLLPAMRRNRQARSSIFTAYRDVQRAVRDERWKVIRYPQVDVTQFFDLRHDPLETNNLAADPRHARELKRMLSLLEREQKRAGDDTPLHVANPKPREWTPPASVASETAWHGFRRRDFKLRGRSAFVTVPQQAAPGRPWVWRTSFPDFHAEVDRALLSNGWHVAYIDCVNLLGSEAALDAYDEFFEYVTARHGLSARPAMEAVSRGGLHAYRYAARRPQRIACIYADTPVMDLKSWPFSWPGAERERGEALRAYGLKDEAELRVWRGNPVDVLAPIANARIPLRHVISLNDRVVPPEANTFEARRRLRELKHDMEVVEVEQGTPESNGHHFPLPQVDETVRFIMRHSTPRE